VYNALVKAIRSFPDSNRFSVLSAATLLSFALTQVIEPSPYTVHVQWLGKSFSMVFHLHAVLVFLAAALTATGMDWLLRGHPSFKEGTRSFEHWILPAMTALILGISLAFSPAGAQWWAAFGVGGVLLTMVFWAEYVALEPADPAYPFATAGLIALSFAIFLILTVILRYAEVNLAGSAAAVFFSAFFREPSRAPPPPFRGMESCLGRRNCADCFEFLYRFLFLSDVTSPNRYLSPRASLRVDAFLSVDGGGTSAAPCGIGTSFHVGADFGNWLFIRVIFVGKSNPVSCVVFFITT
jgi:hypothetical protein